MSLVPKHPRSTTIYLIRQDSGCLQNGQTDCTHIMLACSLASRKSPMVMVVRRLTHGMELKESTNRIKRFNRLKPVPSSADTAC
jgi:hypothetical protein